MSTRNDDLVCLAREWENRQSQYSEVYILINSLKHALNAAEQRITALDTEIAEFEQSFNLYHEATKAAIPLYNAGHGITDSSWPDTGKMVAWLVSEVKDRDKPELKNVELEFLVNAHKGASMENINRLSVAQARIAKLEAINRDSMNTGKVAIKIRQGKNHYHLKEVLNMADAVAIGNIHTVEFCSANCCGWITVNDGKMGWDIPSLGEWFKDNGYRLLTTAAEIRGYFYSLKKPKSDHHLSVAQARIAKLEAVVEGLKDLKPASMLKLKKARPLEKP